MCLPSAGTGAAVGIAIGAAAAAGFIGYGGKKGYDYWKGMQNQHFNGVTVIYVFVLFCFCMLLIFFSGQSFI